MCWKCFKITQKGISELRYFDSVHVFFNRKIVKKTSLKNSKTLKKCQENLQPQEPELQFLKTLIFPRFL